MIIGLKIPYPQGRKGSNPFSGTNLQALARTLLGLSWALAILMMGGPAFAQELVGPPPPATDPWDQSRAIAWAKEQREAAGREARRQANQLCAWSAADLGMTEAVLASAGGHEHNPLVRNRGIRIGLSAAACVLAQHEARGAHPKPAQLRRAKWVRIAAVAVNALVLAR